MKGFRKVFLENVLAIAWLFALVGTLLSLYLSDVLHYAPCVLCWYQRIFLYPLVLILAVAILRKDKEVHHYVLPFSILGGFVAFYHFLLQVGVIPENLLPCTFGVPCTEKYFEFFGFINIPFLSLLAFGFITLCMLLFKKYRHLL